MYKYHLRPAYRSEELLIEIFQGIKYTEANHFVAFLSEVLAQISVTITDILDLWVNDETMFCFTSGLGNFNLSIAVWDLGFITSSQNQEVIIKIDSILSNHSSFEKVAVKFEDYK